MAKFVTMNPQHPFRPILSNAEKYTELQADFYHYMVEQGGITRKTSGDYVTRMKFLAQDYCLDETLTKEKIDEILRLEDEKRVGRATYISRKSLSDFRAGLNKFLAFVHSAYHHQAENKETETVKAIEGDPTISVTERESIVRSRIGQGVFRQRLISYWHGCAISQCAMTPLLVASHIKPWSVSDNFERLDPYNGLLLLPNYDKLFDLGYITFDPQGRIVCSRLLDNIDRKTMGITPDLRLTKVEERHIQYLKYHYEHCFLL